MKIKWAQFFESNLGQKSMFRLLPFMAFFPATIELFRLHTDGAFSSYMYSFVVGYGLSKGGDALSSYMKKGKDA